MIRRSLPVAIVMLRSMPTAKKSSSSNEETPTEKASVDVQRVELNKTEQPLAGIVIGYNADPYLGDPANFGKYTSVLTNPRVIQLSARYEF